MYNNENNNERFTLIVKLAAFFDASNFTLLEEWLQSFHPCQTELYFDFDNDFICDGLQKWFQAN